MRIAIYSSTWLNNSETFIFNLVQSHELFAPIVFCRNRNNLDRFPMQDLEVYLPPNFPPRRGRAQILRRFRTLIEDAYFAFHLRRHRVQLAVAHFGSGGIEMMRAARFAKARLTVIFHGYDATEMLRSRSFSQVYPGLMESTFVFLAVSDFIKERLIESGVPKNQILTHYLGIPLPPRPLPKDFGSRILQVGRLTEKKGHFASLSAFREIYSEYPELTFHIVGDGPLREELMAASASMGISKRVAFLGDLSPVQVQAEMTKADIFLHPSMTAANGDSEGLPTAIMEAMAFGIPVVSTFHAGVPEVVTTATGLLVTERDHHALAHALRRLLDSEEMRQNLGAGGRSRAEEMFDMRRNSRRLEEILLQRLHVAGPPNGTAC